MMELWMRYVPFTYTVHSVTVQLQHVAFKNSDMSCSHNSRNRDGSLCTMLIKSPLNSAKLLSSSSMTRGISGKRRLCRQVPNEGDHSMRFCSKKLTRVMTPKQYQVSGRTNTVGTFQNACFAVKKQARFQGFSRWLTWYHEKASRYTFDAGMIFVWCQRPWDARCAYCDWCSTLNTTRSMVLSRVYACILTLG